MRFTSTMKLVGYRQSNSYHTLFIKHKRGKVIVHVDDMILISNDAKKMERLQKYFATKFEMKDLE